MADTALVRQAVKWVRHNGAVPRVHPNGFIQLDLADDGTRIASQRLHVWPDGDDIPKQTTVTTIHDHRFDMRSTVLAGTLIQRTYDVNTVPEDNGGFSHEIFMAQYPDGRKESQLLGTGVKTAVYHYDPVRIVQGRSYTQRRYAFHDTNWDGLTATLMEKTGEDLEHTPRVLVPLGCQPDNTFVRSDIDVDLLWRYIERALS